MHVVPKTETASPATETASNVPGPRPALDGAEAFRRSIGERLLYATGKDPATVSGHDWLWTLSHVTRDRLVERWIETSRRHHREDAKRVYYLSMEFLMGRALSNGLLALGLYDQCKEALVGLGLDLDELKEHEPDPGLGNGGLGRLAACFLDSMATRGIAGTGYGIRYEYGMFAQRIFEGRQVEQPDAWLANGNPWEFPRPEVTYRVQFGGRVERDAGGKVHWVDSDDIKAMAYDTLVPGYGAETVNALRLWSAKPIRDLDMPLFNEGKHAHAVDHKNRCENISRVLYPDDSTPQGRELRLQQEYFFCSASLQDILHRYIQDHDGWDELPDKVAIHLNDTHPALAVPELMRLLVDQHGLDWDYAWSLCQGVFSYTNHTLMPEALETWPVSLVGALLPRHLEIVYALNDRFLREVSHRRGDDWGLLSRVSLIDEEGEKRVRMANLCALASHKVNGVSKLHSELLKQTIFADFEQLFPGRFINKTNGITPRRWLNQANPSLARLVDSQIGHGWRHDLDLLEGLKRHADDASFRAAFRDVKRANKERLAALVMRETGVAVDPSSLFDVQVKRIHEYKRQLLNLLQVVARYQRILAEPHADWVPRTVLFAGKAASGYWMAKLIIKLIHDVARRINADTRTNDKLKVVFIPNYGVSVAEAIIAGADLSEQISTAGTEASGTGNMKLALNGALTIGTEDGANIEIRENVGHENIFVFGHTAEEIRALKERGYEPWHVAQADPLLRDVLDKIGHGFFSAEEPDRFRPIVDGLMNGDRYFLLADFGDYMAAQDLVDATWRMPEVWTRRAVLNVASMGSFSSDRTIREYAEEIWRIGPRHR